MLLESRGYQQRVHKRLEKTVQQGKLSLNEVVLGSLVNAAARNFDWQRADRLWQLHGVRPKVICHTALECLQQLSVSPEDPKLPWRASKPRVWSRDGLEEALCYLQVF